MMKVWHLSREERGEKIATLSTDPIDRESAPSPGLWGEPAMRENEACAPTFPAYFRAIAHRAARGELPCVRGSHLLKGEREDMAMGADL